jgi:hypothetical protein
VTSGHRKPQNILRFNIAMTFKRLSSVLCKGQRWRSLLLLIALGLVAAWGLVRVDPPKLSDRHGHPASMQLTDDRHASGHAQFVVERTPSFPPVRLLLSTHNRLFWYTPSSQEIEVVHEGQVLLDSCIAVSLLFYPAVPLICRELCHTSHATYF